MMLFRACEITCSIKFYRCFQCDQYSQWPDHLQEIRYPTLNCQPVCSNPHAKYNASLLLAVVQSKVTSFSSTEIDTRNLSESCLHAWNTTRLFFFNVGNFVTIGNPLTNMEPRVFITVAHSDWVRCRKICLSWQIKPIPSFKLLSPVSSIYLSKKRKKKLAIMAKLLVSSLVQDEDKVFRIRLRIG